MTQDPSALLRQARTAFDREELARSEELCSRILVSHPACVEAHQLMARIHLARGDLEKAGQVLDQRDGLPVDEQYVQWGILAEEAGDLEQAAQIYETCLRRSPPPPQALYRLGMLHLERGDRTRAIELLGDAVREKPDFVQALVDLAQCYAEEEWWGLAAQAYRQALERDPDHAEARAGLGLAEARLQELSGLPAAEPSRDESMAEDLLVLFSGREGVHARQWVDADGRVGYGPVHEPLGERIVRMHLRGEVTLGAYVVRNDDTVLFSAVDIDVRKAALARFQEGGEMSPDLAGRVRADVLRLRCRPGRSSGSSKRWCSGRVLLPRSCSGRSSPSRIGWSRAGWAI